MNAAERAFLRQTFGIVGVGTISSRAACDDKLLHTGAQGAFQDVLGAAHLDIVGGTEISHGRSGPPSEAIIRMEGIVVISYEPRASSATFSALFTFSASDSRR